jgi:hypothetical protein
MTFSIKLPRGIARWHFYKTNPNLLARRVMNRMEDFTHVFSRRPVNHDIEGRWKRDRLSATSRLQALQLVQGL